MIDASFTIGILGASGFLGSNLVRYFSAQGYTVYEINRETYNEFQETLFDVFINANGNSKKFWANQNPEADYEASVTSVEKSTQDFRFKKYVYISSSDVYPDHGNPSLTHETAQINIKKLEPYGLHKYEAEQIVKQLPWFLILRCSAMLGEGLQKGVVKDLVSRVELFVTKDSYLQFISCSDIGRSIEKLIASEKCNELYNCGGVGSVVVQDIADIVGVEARVRVDAKKQEYEMNVEKLCTVVKLQSSQEYIQDFLKNNL